MKIFRAVNSFGHPQAVEDKDSGVRNVCSQCRIDYTNHGAGTMCPSCRAEDLRWCETSMAV